MKIRLIKEELSKLSLKDLYEKRDQQRRSLFSTKLNASTAHVKDYSQFKKLRKNIARTLTLITQKKTV